MKNSNKFLGKVIHSIRNYYSLQLVKLQIMPFCDKTITIRQLDHV